MSNNKADTNNMELTEEQRAEGLARIQTIIDMVAQREDSTEEELELLSPVLKNDQKLIKLLASGEWEKAIEHIRNLKAAVAIKTMFMEGGIEEEPGKPLKLKTLLALQQRALDFENPDPDAVDKLKFLLGGILEYAATQQDILENPTTAKTLDAFKTIFEYLQQSAEPVEELDRFIKKQIEFMAIPRPAGLEDLLSISAGMGSKEITFKGDFASGNKITFTGRLGIDEQKIGEMFRLDFASKNPYKAKTGLNTLVELPFSGTMEILGRAQTPRNRKEFARQLRKEMLPSIGHQHLELKAPDGSFIRMEVGGGYFAVDVRHDKIYFKLSDPYAAYLNSGALSQYSSKTVRLGSRQKPLPFYLAIKLQDQYFHDGNRKRKDKQGNPQPTNNILSVKVLLNFCGDMIPRYEQVQQTDRGHWGRLIRQPLEEALNEIQRAGLFSWEYCKRGMAEATPQEIRTNDFRKWSSLYITFKLIPEEPDQTERLEHKQKRLEAAQAKQADKIQKRKGSRKKKADAN